MLNLRMSLRLISVCIANASLVPTPRAPPVRVGSGDETKPMQVHYVCFFLQIYIHMCRLKRIIHNEIK